ncbi:type II toxin-antitoxin system VapB family antitoxin [Thiohalobacter sp. IOR34]|uniref:type II toxin-antitoxin system VapB family antitoxin n=1 Tax=Thiohalobacter sp. IOR34 TaxID=3057176 RepID=UPI00339D89AE
MRTNIVIDDELMAEAMAATGARTKREVVEMALRDLVMRNRQRRLKELKGMNLIDPDYDVIAERHATRSRVPD